MRKGMLFLMLAVCFGCNDSAIEKPDNLIDEDRMVDIIYDLSLLEAIRSHNPGIIQNAKQPNQYIYGKYHIDSLQFAQSNRYYATDILRYKKMYARVGKRLERNKRAQDSLLDKGRQKSDVPVEGGMVK